MSLSGGKGIVIDAVTTEHLPALNLEESRRENLENLEAREEKELDESLNRYLRAQHTTLETEYSALSNAWDSLKHGFLSGAYTIKTMGVSFAEGIAHLASNTWKRAVEGNDFVPVIGFALGGFGGLGEGIVEGAIGLFQNGGGTLENMWFATLHAATLEPEKIGEAYGQAIMTVEGAIGLISGVRSGLGVIQKVTSLPKNGTGIALTPEGLAVAGVSTDAAGFATATGNMPGMAGLIFMRGDEKANSGSEKPIQEMSIDEIIAEYGPENFTAAEVIGDIARRLRLEKGISQVKLAREIRVPNSQFVSRLEFGKSWGRKRWRELEDFFSLERGFFERLETKLREKKFDMLTELTTPETRLISQEVLKLRTERRWTRAELSRQVEGLTVYALNQIEKGASRGERYHVAFEKVFGLEAGYFSRLLADTGLPVKGKGKARSTITPKWHSTTRIPSKEFSPKAQITENLLEKVVTYFQEEIPEIIKDVIDHPDKLIVLTEEGSMYEITMSTILRVQIQKVYSP